MSNGQRSDGYTVDPKGYAIGIPLCMAIGIVIGILTGNLALGIDLGVAVGAGVGTALGVSRPKAEEQPPRH